MQSSYSERQVRAFAEWLSQPLTPGAERALNRWLSEDPSNQEIWESWQRINARAKRLQVVPGDVNADWMLLKAELGFVSTGKYRKRTHSASHRREFHKQPAVVAIISMIAYSIFLYVLHMIRVKAGF